MGSKQTKFARAVLTVLVIYAGAMLGLFSFGWVGADLPPLPTSTRYPTSPPEQLFSPPTSTPEPSELPTDEPQSSTPNIEPPDPFIPETSSWSPLKLDEAIPTYMIFGLNTSPGLTSISTDIFYPVEWYPGVFQSEAFDPEKGGAVSWVDNGGRTTLWVHSGPDNTMTSVQQYIETMPFTGFRVSAKEADRRLDEDIQDGRVTFVQSLTLIAGRVVAWARISPDLVEESNSHVMDLPVWLQDHYPDQGWSFIQGVSDSIMIYFCGRQLQGEEGDSSRPYWQQARIILGIVPDQVFPPPLDDGDQLNAMR